MHMSVGIILVMVQAYVQLRYKFRNINDLRFGEPQEIQELRHEITIWQRAAASLSSYSKDEDLVRETLVKKVNRLQRLLKKKLSSGAVPNESYKQTLEDLQKKVSAFEFYQFIVHLVYNIVLFPFSVSDPKLATIDQIRCDIDFRHHLLLPALCARDSKTIARLDGIVGRCATSNSLGP